MTRYIISDSHLGHNNIHKFRTGMDLYAAEDHWEAALEGLRRVSKRDTLFLLGDIAFTPHFLGEIKKLPCRNRVLIAGNHDTDRSDITMKHLVDTYDKVYSLHKYRGHWMTHAPIHPMELRGKVNVHGHMHPYLVLDEAGEPDTRYRSVCVEYTSYVPITWEYMISDEYAQHCKREWSRYNKLRELEE